MRTIQMTLDDPVDAVDKVVKKLRTTRSAFTRQALRNAVTQANIKQMENKHKLVLEKRSFVRVAFSLCD
ncbi:MAG: CopG family transcriptional regulator [Planctomycetota bacterium]